MVLGQLTLSCLYSFNKHESSICKWWLDSLLSFKASGNQYLVRQQLVFHTREDQSTEIRISISGNWQQAS